MHVRESESSGHGRFELPGIKNQATFRSLG
jgi:hypothetical protein